MKVVIASQNPAKIRAARDAFALQFGVEQLDFVAVSVDSGVSAQPRCDEVTRRGARNRAINALALHADARFGVGMEGGIETIDDQLMAFAWMAVLDDGGHISLTRTVTLPLPPRVKALLDQGMELGDANDRVFKTVNSKHKGGAFGLLTDGRHTRESVYTQALVMALIPFTHALYRGAGN